MSDTLNTDYYSSGSELPSFMVFPKFLMEIPLSETSRILYMVLLDRAKLSAQNPQWTESDGRVFLCYPVSELSKAISRSETTVKESLRSLEQAGLLERKRQGIGRPNRLYLRMPVQISDQQKATSQTGEKVPMRETESTPSHGQVSEPFTGRNVTGNNNDKSNNYIDKQFSKKAAHTPLGRYRNVYLSDEELEQLRREIPLLSEYIERLSSYMKQKNRSYNSHADTIRRWYFKDHPRAPVRSYDCSEEDSL